MPTLSILPAWKSSYCLWRALVPAYVPGRAGCLMRMSIIKNMNQEGQGALQVDDWNFGFLERAEQGWRHDMHEACTHDHCGSLM